MNYVTRRLTTFKMAHYPSEQFIFRVPYRTIINQGPDFDDMSSFFPCEIDDAIQYINLGYGAQAPKTVIL